MARVNVSETSLKKIIVDGDPEELVKQAEEVGGTLAKSLKTSQIRNIFGSVRQIQMNWPPEPKDRSELKAEDLKRLQDAADKGWRQLLLLIPKLKYQGERIKDVKPLAGVLEPAIKLVDKDRGRFQNFAEFFEAILAYHTASGGRS
jgi:CRISPR-associated protein Csm2